LARYFVRDSGYGTALRRRGLGAALLHVLPRRLRRHRWSERGQSIVEFALVLPIIVFLMVAIIDFGRVYATMLSVESAAREAADYGTFGSQKWVDSAVPTTVAEMEHRACVAAGDLPDFAGSPTTCTNPTMTYCLSPDNGASCVTYSDALDCDDPDREPPCRLSVTLTHQFRLLVPLNFEAFGVHYGIPTSITFSRTSTYPMTDLSLDP
jgi:hypothetical protein